MSSRIWVGVGLDGLVHCRLFTRSSTRSAPLTATLVSDFQCVLGGLGVRRWVSGLSATVNYSDLSCCDTAMLTSLSYI